MENVSTRRSGFNPDRDQLLTPIDVCECLRVSRRTFERIVARGELRPIVVGGRLRRFFARASGGVHPSACPFALGANGYPDDSAAGLRARANSAVALGLRVRFARRITAAADSLLALQ